MERLVRGHEQSTGLTVWTTADTAYAGRVTTVQEPNLDPYPTQTLALTQTSPALSLLPLPALVLTAPIMMAVIVVSAGGNIMVLMSFRRGSMPADAHSLYLLNLAAGDLLISALCMPLHLVSTLFSARWLLGPTLCRLYTAVQLTLLNATTFLLVLVALDGLRQANRGVRCTMAVARRRAKLLLAACWTLAIAVHVPETLGRGWDVELEPVSYEECKPDFYRNVGHVLFLQAWDFFLPVFVLSVVNTKLYLRLKSISLNMLAYRPQSVQREPPFQTPAELCVTALQPYKCKSITDIQQAAAQSDFNESAAVTFHPANDCQDGHVTDTLGKQANKPNSPSPSALSKKAAIFGKHLASKTILQKQIIRPTMKRVRRQKRAGSLKHYGPGKTTWTPSNTGKTTWTAANTKAATSFHHADDKGGEGDTGTGSEQQLRQKRRQMSLDRPRRLTRVAAILLTLVLTLVACWLPYSVVVVVDAVCVDCVPPVLHGGLVWLLYCKSCINPFLYAYNTFAFRNKFRRLLARVLRAKRFKRIPTDRVSNERASILN